MAASSVIVIVAERMPAVSGENVTEITQLELAATAPLQFDAPTKKSPELKPPNTTAMICRDALPVFDTVIFCGELEVPCVVVPGRLNGFKVLNEATGAGAGGATAVAASEIDCGLVGEFPVMVMTAALLPTFAGE